MERWQSKVAVVTGASSGIGAAIVKDLVNAGVQVVGLARRKERVEEMIANLPADRKSLLTAIKCDVSDPQSVNEAFDEIVEKFGGIDILVNNAGCYKAGQLVAMDTQDIQNVIQTNVMGIVYCTQRAFKSMKDRNMDGHVVLINSVAGHKVYSGLTGGAVPTANIYSPSKFAVTALTEMYRLEFKGLGTKIKITSICPGLVDTEIVNDAAKKAMSHCILKAEDISNAVLYTLSSPPHVQIHELSIKPVGEMF